jgi:hypothetical protein
MNARELTVALGGTWNAPRREGKARCPGHDDSDPSLDIAEKNGGTVFICRAGCDQHAVLDALKARGLWRTNGTANDDGTLRHPDLAKPDIVFRYHNAEAELVGVVCRWNARAGKKKELRPATYDAGKWRWNAFPEPRPLYHLPDLVAQPDKPVLVVEGEKAVDAARDIITCHVVTTWPGGSKAIKEADWRPLRGRDVVLWPDNDEAGKTAMRAIADRLTDARTVRGIKLPDGLPEKWDLGDPIPADLDPVALIGRARDLRGERLASLGLVSADALLAADFKPVRFAVPGLIPEGLGIFAGNPKAGKSWLILGVGVAVADGGLALGNIACAAGDVLLICLEDTPRRLAARLRAVLQGAPAPSRLDIATAWRRADEGGLADLRAWLTAHPNARLVAIDTLALIRGKPTRDQGVYAADYEAISAFKKVADEFGVAIILVHHRSKESRADPLASVSGTQGLTGSADTILVLDRKPKESHGMLYVRGRDVVEDELALQFDSETGRWLKVGAADDFRRSEQRRAILRLLIDSGDPMTPVDIAKALGKRGDAMRQTLIRMRKAGEVSQLPNGKYYATRT